MQAECLLIRPDDRRWYDGLANAPHDIYHLPEYASLADRSPGVTTLAFRYAEADDVLLLPLNLRPVAESGRIDAVTPYGYSGPVSSTGNAGFWERACLALIACLAEAEVVSCFARLHPLLDTPREVLERFGDVPTRGNTVSINLNLSDAESWTQFRPNHRRNIMRARRAGMCVEFDDWERLGEFVDIYQQTMRRVGASAEYAFRADYFESLRVLADGVHLAVVLAAERVVAGGVFFECSGIVQYHLGATRTESLQNQPSKLMIEEMRRWARERGNSVLHLGGGITGEATDPLLHYKAGFSKSRHPFHTWHLVVDQSSYDELSRPAPDCSSPAAFFPSYRRPSRTLGASAQM